MKIRLMGSPDLAAGFAQAMAAYGFSVSGPYQNRQPSTEVRYYVEIDDRKAEQAINNMQAAHKLLSKGEA